MLTQEENDALTEVGPGTPMGAVLRHYCCLLYTSDAADE